MNHRTRTIFSFTGWFLFVFLVTFSILYAAGVVPSEIRATAEVPLAQDVKDIVDAPPEAVGQEPVKIVISSVGINAPVLNPTTTNVEKLDEYLHSGAVRYPGSGLAGQGNMFLFGHSTGLKVVNNPAYKTFNNLKKVVRGDVITVYSRDRQYTYEVDSVTLASAQDVLVEFGGSERKLTLATCNTFGAKEERHIVVAHFVSDSPIY